MSTPTEYARLAEDYANDLGAARQTIAELREAVEVNASEARVFASLCREWRTQRDALAQAMHDGRGILGFDLDGDATPAAQMGRLDLFVAGFLADMRQERADYEEALSLAYGDGDGDA